MSPIVGGVIAATSGNQQQHTNLMSGGLKEEDVDPSSYDGSKWKFDYFPQQHLKAWKQTDFYFINMYHNFCSLFCCFLLSSFTSMLLLCSLLLLTNFEISL